jgi:hypothetical protein
VLLWMPAANAEWPVTLVMQEPVSLPAGSKVVLVAETGNAVGGSADLGIAKAGGTRPTSVTLSVLSDGR